VDDQGLRGWLRRNRDGLALGLVGMVLVGATTSFVQRPAPAVVVQTATPRPSPVPPSPAPIAVHVSGEVAAPGLYQFAPGARINDALRAAGGATADGDVQRLNLAARLADGQQLVVPRKSDLQAGTSPGPAARPKININSASVAELDTLPGLGPVMAQRIVAHREQNGPFTSVDELRDAKLVNAATYDKIKDLVSP
jgi:competence protein ComEA